MRYFGSKASALPTLQAIITARVRGGSFADPFGGIGVVGGRFRELGFTVSSGDLLSFPVMFQNAALALEDSASVRKDIDDVRHDMQNLRREEDWVYEYYARDRAFFTPANARAIDASRLYLEKLSHTGELDQSLTNHLLASLIESADRVANTAGTYYAHLKSWNRRALRPFHFKPLPIRSGPIGEAAIRNASVTAAAQPYNVIYLDPPYNGRDYSAYYHLPESLARGKRPTPHGKSGVNAERTGRSSYASRATALSALESLLSSARCELLIVHYRDDGCVRPEEMRSLLGSIGKVVEHPLTVPGYSTTGARIDLQRIYEVTPR